MIPLRRVTEKGGAFGVKSCEEAFGQGRRDGFERVLSRGPLSQKYIGLIHASNPVPDRRDPPSAEILTRPSSYH